MLKLKLVYEMNRTVLSALEEQPLNKRKLIREVESFITCLWNIIENGDIDRKSVKEIISSKVNFLTKDGITSTSIVKASYTCYENNRSKLTQLPYDYSWPYNSNLTLVFAPKVEISYRTIVDVLLPTTKKESKLDIIVHKYVLNIMKIFAEVDEDEESLLISKKIINDINVELGLVQPNSSDLDSQNPFGGLGNMLNSSGLSEIMAKLSNPEGGGISGALESNPALQNAFAGMMRNEEMMNVITPFVPENFKEAFEEQKRAALTSSQ